MLALNNAIKARAEIEFIYDGQRRIVRPAAHGLHKTTGNAVLRGYQVGGRSSSRATPFWDLYLVAKIQNLKITDRTFLMDPPHYSRNDQAMATIFTQL